MIIQYDGYHTQYQYHFCHFVFGHFVFWKVAELLSCSTQGGIREIIQPSPSLFSD